jgi:hypothetical protein
VPDFAGLKLSQDPVAVKLFPEIGQVTCVRKTDEMLLDEPGVIGWGGNSGFHAINLAAQFGARRIVLVGYDMTMKNGLHWHGAHPRGLNNPTKGNVDRWRRAIDGGAPVLEAAGIEVINATPDSALQAYPFMPLEEALSC